VAGRRAQPSPGNSFLLQIGSVVGDNALYAVTKKPSNLGHTAWLPVAEQEEPVFRAFFAGLGALCGRTVEGPGGA